MITHRCFVFRNFFDFRLFVVMCVTLGMCLYHMCVTGVTCESPVDMVLRLKPITRKFAEEVECSMEHADLF